MDNLEYYNKLKVVPEEAKKTIQGGRLKGMTDINPMWRIKMLTETFGLCGIGWKYEVVSQRLEAGANEIAAFVTINLFVKVGEWSEPIPGLGGSSFVANEKNGLYVSDECFKMALTDALSVACKALGMGAEVYFAKDRTKYDDADKKEVKALPALTDEQLLKAISRANGGEPDIWVRLLETFSLTEAQKLIFTNGTKP